jgi:long-chain acyl-CoA synthetase
LTVPAKDGCAASDILGYCAGKLPKIKVPSEVRFVRTLPKKASGKIDRATCLAMFTATK